MIPKLLIVDDEHAIRFAMADYFAAQGFAVDAASNRPAARDRLAETTYDMVIVDLRLTGSACTDGLEIIREICSSGVATQVVLLTGSTSTDIVAAAMAQGAAAVLFKSSGLPHVREIVNNLLGRQVTSSS